MRRSRLAAWRPANYCGAVEERTRHARLSVDPETGEVESRELNVVSDMPADGKHTLLSIDLTDALAALDEDETPPAA